MVRKEKKDYSIENFRSEQDCPDCGRKTVVTGRSWVDQQIPKTIQILTCLASLLMGIGMGFFLGFALGALN